MDKLLLIILLAALIFALYWIQQKMFDTSTHKRKPVSSVPELYIEGDDTDSAFSDDLSINTESNSLFSNESTNILDKIIEQEEE